MRIDDCSSAGQAVAASSRNTGMHYLKNKLLQILKRIKDDTRRDLMPFRRIVIETVMSIELESYDL